MRQTAKHRLVQLGIRQARYFGRQKTLFQLLMAATVANLTLIATKTEQMSTKKGPILSFLSGRTSCKGLSDKPSWGVSIWFIISVGCLPLRFQIYRFSAELLVSILR